MSPLTTFLSRLIGLFCILISVSMAAQAVELALAKHTAIRRCCDHHPQA